MRRFLKYKDARPKPKAIKTIKAETAIFPNAVTRKCSLSANMTSEYKPPINAASSKRYVFASFLLRTFVKSKIKYVIKKLTTNSTST